MPLPPGTLLDRTVVIKVRASDTVQAMCCGLVAAVLLTGTVRAQRSPIEAVGTIPRQTIGVMPFANVSRAEADRWIGAGIAETLASDLLHTPGIEVLDLGGLTQAVRDGTSPGAEEPDDLVALRIGRERGATWLITGGYQRVGDRLRVIARLLVVDTGDVFHTVRVDGTVDELFMLQDRVGEAVSAQLRTAGGARVPGDAARRDRPSRPTGPSPLTLRSAASGRGAGAGSLRRCSPRRRSRPAGWRVRGANSGPRRTPTTAATGDDRPRRGRPRHRQSRTAPRGADDRWCPRRGSL